MLLSSLATNEFNRDGVILRRDVLNSFQIQKLLDYFNQTSDQDLEGYYSTNWLKDADKRENDFLEIRNILSDNLKNDFYGYRLVMATFMVKESTGDSSLIIHQDWAFTDERKNNSINVWIPLIDINPINGPLSFLAGSHKINNFIRGKFVNQIFRNTEPLLQKIIGKTFYPKAGDALIFDVKTAHYSSANNSGKRRIAISLVMIPDEAELVHFIKKSKEDKWIYKVCVDHEYFFKYRMDELPESYTVLKRFKDIRYPKLFRIRSFFKLLTLKYLSK